MEASQGVPVEEELQQIQEQPEVPPPPIEGLPEEMPSEEGI